MTVSLTKRTSGLVLALALAAAACNNGGASTAPVTQAPGTQPAGTAAALSGKIVIDGSSTVYPITEAVAEEFHAANPGVDVTVGFAGTGGGFKKFCNNETDMNDASRPIKTTDTADAKSEGTLCKDGSYDLKVPYADDRELIMDIMKYGGDCEVIAPKSLRERVLAEAERTWDVYRSA